MSVNRNKQLFSEYHRGRGSTLDPFTEENSWRKGNQPALQQTELLGRNLLYLIRKENIRVNVTMLKTSEESQEAQVVFNITYNSGQIYVNDFPMKRGVTRIKCQTLILETGNSDNLLDQRHWGIVSVRILFREWPLASRSNLQLIVIQEEVTEIDGREVQQEEVTEINILIKGLRVLRHSNHTVPLKESMLYSIPRDNDVLFTLPNLSGKVDVQGPLQPTSHYLLRQAETTVDEETLPGKLPETPLRTEPPSSYKVMCQWVEYLRKELCGFWLTSFPVFFKLMEVIGTGVVGAALVLGILKVLFPSCEHKGVLHLEDINTTAGLVINISSDIPEKTDNLVEK
ncbi:glycoprotein integral membrane protein 1 isoform X1 [Gopherus flavomarginatus]|uniref:glycoprotein integral membrane protein 1 isoform X1 n=2 Tax=Gopherus flavomarginatus TaxID=286002 RepID=UPI0021CBD563|nr:glycoprotein integral membrane protein 1 isoform X1 [Gopherus flavomarginatus]